MHHHTAHFIMKWRCLHSLQSVHLNTTPPSLCGFGPCSLTLMIYFFHLIPLSLTTSWCNAPVNPCTFTICLCNCKNTALHAAWVPVMNNAEYYIVCSRVVPISDPSISDWEDNVLFSYQCYTHTVLTTFLSIQCGTCFNEATSNRCPATWLRFTNQM